MEYAWSHDHRQCFAKGWGALRVPTFIYHPAFGSLMSHMVCVLTEKDSLGETIHERTLKGGNRLLGMNKWIYCVISGFGRAEFLLLQRKWLSLLGDLV